jgi:hypothetical protein
MPALQQQNLFSMTITSNGTSAPIDAPDITILSIMLAMSAGSGAGNLSVFLEGSCDGVNWDSVPPSWGKDYGNGTAVHYGNFSGSRVNIVNAAVGTTGNGNSSATYAHLGFSKYRLRWTASGTVSFTVRADASGK